MKNKFLLPLISLFAISLLLGTTYSAWVFNESADMDHTAQVEIPA